MEIGTALGIIKETCETMEDCRRCPFLEFCGFPVYAIDMDNLIEILQTFQEEMDKTEFVDRMFGEQNNG